MELNRSNSIGLFFLLDYLKTIVYSDPSTSLINLEEKIISAYIQITKEQIANATNKTFLWRAESYFIQFEKKLIR